MRIPPTHLLMQSTVENLLIISIDITESRGWNLPRRKFPATQLSINNFIIHYTHAGEEFLHGLGSTADPSKYPPPNELEAVARLHLRPPAHPTVALAVQTKATHWWHNSWNHYRRHSHSSRYVEYAELMYCWSMDNWQMTVSLCWNTKIVVHYTFSPFFVVFRSKQCWKAGWMVSINITCGWDSWALRHILHTNQ